MVPGPEAVTQPSEEIVTVEFGDADKTYVRLRIIESFSPLGTKNKIEASLGRGKNLQ